MTISKLTDFSNNGSCTVHKTRHNDNGHRITSKLNPKNLAKLSRAKIKERAESVIEALVYDPQISSEDFEKHYILQISRNLIAASNLKSNQISRGHLINVLLVIMSFTLFLIPLAVKFWVPNKERTQREINDVNAYALDLIHKTANQIAANVENVNALFNTLNTPQKLCVISYKETNAKIIMDPKLFDPKDLPIPADFVKALSDCPRWSINGGIGTFPPPLGLPGERLNGMRSFISNIPIYLKLRNLEAGPFANVLQNIAKLHTLEAADQGALRVQKIMGVRPISSIESVSLDSIDGKIVSTMILSHKVEIPGKPPAYIVETLERMFPVDILQKKSENITKAELRKIKVNSSYSKKLDTEAKNKYIKLKIAATRALSVLKDPVFHLPHSTVSHASHEFVTDFHRTSSMYINITNKKQTQKLAYNHGRIVDEDGKPKKDSIGLEAAGEGIQLLIEELNKLFHNKTFFENFSCLIPQGSWVGNVEELIKSSIERYRRKIVPSSSNGTGDFIILIDDKKATIGSSTVFKILDLENPTKVLGYVFFKMDRSFPSSSLTKPHKEISMSDLEGMQSDLTFEFYDVEQIPSYIEEDSPEFLEASEKYEQDLKAALEHVTAKAETFLKDSLKKEGFIKNKDPA
jgi:hypothetical protein